jgi:hypothetical protein
VAAFYSSFISSARRLPNGNILIDEGMNGRVFQVTGDGEIVWEYVSPYFGPAPLGPAGKKLLTNWIYRAQPVPYDWVPPDTPHGERAVDSTRSQHLPHASRALIPALFVAGREYPRWSNRARRKAVGIALGAGPGFSPPTRSHTAVGNFPGFLRLLGVVAAARSQFTASGNRYRNMRGQRARLRDRCRQIFPVP